MEIRSSGQPGSGKHGDSLSPGNAEAAEPGQSPRSSVDRKSEADALACLDRGKRDDALDILARAYGARITAFCYRIVRHRELAEDVGQQVFLKACEQIETFGRRGTLWAWLCGIAYHRCLDELKRPANTRNDPLEAMEELVDPSAPAESPDRLAKQRALERCLGKLDPSVRAQVLMRYFFGLSDAEIGELVGDAPGTVQRRILRSLPVLRKCLSDEGEHR